MSSTRPTTAAELTITSCSRDASADFQIFGMADDSEFFVDFLRFTFEGGGFRGPSDANQERAWKVLPKLGLTKQLADGLLPI